jgi:hypothetical protein
VCKSKTRVLAVARLLVAVARGFIIVLAVTELLLVPGRLVVLVAVAAAAGLPLVLIVIVLLLATIGSSLFLSRLLFVVLVEVLVRRVPGDSQHSSAHHSRGHLRHQQLAAMVLLLLVNIGTVLQILNLHTQSTFRN